MIVSAILCALCLTYGILFFREADKSDSEDNAIDYGLLSLSETTAVVAFIILAGAIYMQAKGALSTTFCVVTVIVCVPTICLSRVGIYNALSTPNEPELDISGKIIGGTFIGVGSLALVVFIASTVYKIKIQ